MTVHDDAAAALRARLDALPGSRRLTAEQLEVIYAMAYAHVARCEYGKALPIFAFLAQYGPTRKHYWAGLALCLQKTDRPDEARNIYALILTLYPDSADAVLRTAECELALGENERAQAALFGAIAIDAESGQLGPVSHRARALLDLISVSHPE